MWGQWQEGRSGLCPRRGDGPGRGGLGPGPQPQRPGSCRGHLGRVRCRQPQWAVWDAGAQDPPALGQQHQGGCGSTVLTEPSRHRDRQERSQQVLCPCAPPPPARWAEGRTDPSLVGWRPCPGGRGWLREHEMLPAGKSQPKALRRQRRLTWPPPEGPDPSSGADEHTVCSPRRSGTLPAGSRAPLQGAQTQREFPAHLPARAAGERASELASSADAGSTPPSPGLASPPPVRGCRTAKPPTPNTIPEKRGSGAAQTKAGGFCLQSPPCAPLPPAHHWGNRCGQCPYSRTDLQAGDRRGGSSAGKGGRGRGCGTGRQQGRTPHAFLSGLCSGSRWCKARARFLPLSHLKLSPRSEHRCFTSPKE